MSEAKHTAGPWAAHDTQFGDTDIRKAVAENLSGHGLPLKCILADSRPIAHTDGIYNGARDLAAEEANAALLAAAPDLYEAAKKALNYIANTEGELGITLICGDMLRAAIAKAKST